LCPGNGIVDRVPPSARQAQTAHHGRKAATAKAGVVTGGAARRGIKYGQQAQASSKGRASKTVVVEIALCRKYERGASLTELAKTSHKRPLTLAGILKRNGVALREETHEELALLETRRSERLARSASTAVRAGDAATKLQTEAASALQRLVAKASVGEVKEFVQLAKMSPDAETEPAPWGEPPSATELANAVLANTRKKFALRRTVERDSLTRSATATALGTSSTAVTDRLEAGRLVGLKRGREWLIPSWQLDADSRDGILVGLEELLSVFPAGPVSLSNWVKKPSVDLDGQSPEEALRKGRVSEVVNLARQLSAAGW
jgi:hypothetical protein